MLLDTDTPWTVFNRSGAMFWIPTSEKRRLLVAESGFNRSGAMFWIPTDLLGRRYTQRLLVSIAQARCFGFLQI